MGGRGTQFTRRDFIKSAAVGGAAAAGLAASPRLAAQEKPPLPRRKLGETDLEVSVVGYGAEFISDQGLVEHLISEGVNHIDTAALYLGGNSERRLAPVLAKYGDDVVIGTKFLRTISPDAPKEAFLDDFNASCDRMEVDGVDILYLHDRRMPEAVESIGAKQAVDELREAGRVKYFGMSVHLNQVACIQKALELGWFDVLMVAHSFMYPAPNEDAIKAAADKGLGIMLIKICKALSGGKDWYPRATDEQKAILGAANLFQASIKWAMQKDFASAIVLCMSNYEEAAEDLAAAREALSATEARALHTYRELASSSICRGCGSCDSACPKGVAVSDVLRYKAYCEGYGQRESAVAMYQSLPERRTFAACDNCGVCEQACPYGLAIRRELEGAHALLA